ncbi:hypothetical protein BD770DRAFT_389816 [Pilaira anomala]|nr:hypothetical protein BD770DRAFT_389816 [Pilaira anomala]
MEESSNRDQGIWTNSPTTRHSDGNPSKPNINQDMGSFRRTRPAVSKFSQTERDRPRLNTYINNSKITPSGTKINNYTKDATMSRNAGLSLQSGDEKKVVENGSTKNNAGNYQERKGIDNEGVPALTRRKTSFQTEQISCTLHDLILGTKSPTIQLAISKMQEDGIQSNSRSSTTSSSPVPFEFIVEEQKKLTKTYNTNAKEFVPRFQLEKNNDQLRFSC